MFEAKKQTAMEIPCWESQSRPASFKLSTAVDD